MKTSRLSLMIAIFTFLAVLASQALAAQWYEGGTLHRASGRVWQQASQEDRLATSADFAATVLQGQVSTLERLKPYAVKLRGCITRATEEEGAGSQKVSEIAAACVILMEW